MQAAADAILVINCGSSSIKYALIDAQGRIMAQGLAEKLGHSDACLSHSTHLPTQHEHKQKLTKAMHQEALSVILDLFGQIQPRAIGHRVVHGGRLHEAVHINAATLAKIQQASVLAPLHNPANLAGIEAAQALYPNLPQVAVFDTAFHHSLPARAYRYAIPEFLYREHHIRRYGFHGTSHAYVHEQAEAASGIKHGGWLSAHLGNGCSTCAIWQGESVDTSMGFTPLEGVVMGTRSGDVDPGLSYFLASQLDWSPKEIDQMLNQQSGLLALSGLSNDMRNLTAAADRGHTGAALAIEVFCYRLAKSLAAMSCALPHLDGVIFTGGIGENASHIRAKTVQLLPHFGLSLCRYKNQQQAPDKAYRIDTGTGPQIWVITTNEEARIAQETRLALGLQQQQQQQQ